MLKKLRILDEDRPIYDAQKAGADCPNCPFNGRRPVGPSYAVKGGVRQSPALVILGESPGDREDEAGKPFVGASGFLLNQCLRQFQVKRETLHITNTVLCRPKQGATEDEWSQAIKCCAPRLERELDNVVSRKDDGVDYPTILACGNYALKALTGKSGIFDWMGAPVETKYGVVLPSIHPTFALRVPAYLPVFKTFFARALRIAKGQEEVPYVWPEFNWKGPYATDLERLLASEEPLSVDIENAPISNYIRCIGVGTTKLSVSVYLEWATPRDLELLKQLLSSVRRKVLQNGQFDRVKLEEAGYVVSGPFDDTLLMHAVVAPRLPHDLSFMAAVELPAERWKTEFHVKGEEKEKALKVFERAPPEKLLPYNCRDVAAQALLGESFNVRLRDTHRGFELYGELLELNEIALRMHRFGFPIDESRLGFHKENLTNALAKLETQFRALVPSPDYKLGADGTHHTLRKLYFDRFKAPVVQRSEENQPSLNNKALTYYVGYFVKLNAPALAEVSRIILQYRKLAKLLVNYVANLPLVNGFVHPLWRVFGTRTGRWSASGPPVQTIPKGMRDLYRALYTLVGADYKQLEVRVLAHLSGSPLLLQWFAEGKDVHLMTAQLVFGELNKRLGLDKPTDKQRTICKRVVFGLIYGGTPETMWKALIVDFPDITLEMVEVSCKLFLDAHHHVKEWQTKVISDTEDQGYVEESLSGRRQYYLDGRVVPTEPPNFKIQGMAGTIVNRAAKRVDARLDWGKQFLRAQVHDELLVDGEDVAGLSQILKESMELPVVYDGREMTYLADIKHGPNWLNLVH
jgi:uracil-DNA glycosylase family 4